MVAAKNEKDLFDKEKAKKAYICVNKWSAHDRPDAGEKTKV